MSTVPDLLRHLGGVPVGGSGFQGWWGDDIFFADFDNGTIGNGAKGPDEACKYLDTAIALAGPNDTIYVRPRAPEAGGVAPYHSSDPGDITPQTASTNWTIPWTSHGLSLIGTGIGVGSAGAQRTCLQGDATITTTPVLTLNAPYCNIENIGFKNGASTIALIRTKFSNDSIYQAWGNSFYNVWFRNTGTTKGLNIDSGSYDNIVNCCFSSCDFGIYFETVNEQTKQETIRNCDFLGEGSDVDVDIQHIGSAYRILITKCNFNHTIPTGGSTNHYLNFSATSTGMFSDSYLGSAAAGETPNITLNGLAFSHIYAGDGAILATT